MSPLLQQDATGEGGCRHGPTLSKGVRFRRLCWLKCKKTSSHGSGARFAQLRFIPEACNELARELGAAVAQGVTGGGRADQGGEDRFIKNQLNLKGFEGVGTFSGGEEGWTNWSWKMRVAIGAMHRELSEVLLLAESHEGQTAEELVNKDVDMRDTEQARVVKASQELYSVLVR